MREELYNAHQWRYATKKFKSDADVDQQDIDAILEAVRMAPTSMGLQPFHVYVVERGSALRQKLYEYSKQSQILDAHYLLIFAPKTDMPKSEIADFVQMEGEKRGFGEEQIQKRIEGVERFVESKRGAVFYEWSARQTYIALGFGLQAAALLEVDTCPMEGFKGEEFDRILNTADKNVKAAALLTVGRRSPEDSLRDKTKVRKSKEDLFTLISQ